MKDEEEGEKAGNPEMNQRLLELSSRLRICAIAWRGRYEWDRWMFMTVHDCSWMFSSETGRFETRPKLHLSYDSSTTKLLLLLSPPKPYQIRGGGVVNDYRIIGWHGDRLWLDFRSEWIRCILIVSVEALKSWSFKELTLWSSEAPLFTWSWAW